MYKGKVGSIQTNPVCPWEASQAFLMAVMAASLCSWSWANILSSLSLSSSCLAAAIASSLSSS